MTPKEILIKEGHIIQFKSGDYAYYFQNSLGKFLILGHWGFFDLDDYDEDLLYKNRKQSFCDIEKIYAVDILCFESDFKSFKWGLELWEKGMITKELDKLIFKRNG